MDDGDLGSTILQTLVQIVEHGLDPLQVMQQHFALAHDAPAHAHVTEPHAAAANSDAATSAGTASFDCPRDGNYDPPLSEYDPNARFTEQE